MKYLFIEYPKCSTCQKAKAWLNENQVEYIDRHIVEQNPTYQELKKWKEQSNYPLKKFFNTSGNKYKELNLKEKLRELTEEEQLHLLASNGMLVKRPLLIGDNTILIGFKQDKWEKILK